MEDCVKYVGKTAHPCLAMHRERSSMWKQNDTYMSDFNQIVLREDGSAEIHGAAVRFPKLNFKPAMYVCTILPNFA